MHLSVQLVSSLKTSTSATSEIPETFTGRTFLQDSVEEPFISVKASEELSRLEVIREELEAKKEKPEVFILGKATTCSLSSEYPYLEIFQSLRTKIPYRELLEMPKPAQRILARVVRAPPDFIKPVGPDSFELNFSLIQQEDVYYAFSLWNVHFLAKRRGNVITVLETHETKNGVIIAWPLYEVEIK